MLCEIEPKMLFVFLMMWSVVEVRLTRTCLEVTLGMILTKNKITIISFWVVCKRNMKVEKGTWLHCLPTPDDFSPNGNSSATNRRRMKKVKSTTPSEKKKATKITPSKYYDGYVCIDYIYISVCVMFIFFIVPSIRSKETVAFDL